MPTIDGWEAIKLLKADARTKGIPIIIVDNMCQREEVQKGLELGVVYHCCKAQYTPAEVANIFRDQLMKRDPDYRDKFNTESYY
jgi:CheY-like chemotaxis protein